MPKNIPKQKGFRDFTLIELSHLERGDFSSVSGIDPMTVLRARLEAGKKAIDIHSKPGDLVLLESPEKALPEDYSYFSEKFALTLKKSYNFYHELAEYAKQKGRRIGTLESGVTTFSGRLHKMYSQSMFYGSPEQMPEPTLRVLYLVAVRRNIHMRNLIQRQKPAMVIAVGTHAVYLEHALKPRQVIYNGHWDKEKILAWLKSIQQAYLRTKRKRRTGINKKLGIKKGKIKYKRL